MLIKTSSSSSRVYIPTRVNTAPVHIKYKNIIKNLVFFNVFCGIHKIIIKTLISL